MSKRDDFRHQSQPQIGIQVIKADTPVVVQIQKDGLELLKVAQAKTSELTKNWEGKVEEFITEGRAYVAIAGNEVRRVIDLGAAKSGEIINQVKNYDYGSSVEQVKSQLGSVAEQVTSKSADFTVELGDKLGVYYQQALDATGKITFIESMIASI